MEKRNYTAMIGKLNDGFGSNGWADGYADLPSDYEEILNQLCNKVSDAILIECLDLYLQGYELGSFMSEEAENIYDEDGEFRDDAYNLGTFSHEKEAQLLLLRKKQAIYGIRHSIANINRV